MDELNTIKQGAENILGGVADWAKKSVYNVYDNITHPGRTISKLTTPSSDPTSPFYKAPPETPVSQRGEELSMPTNTPKISASEMEKMQTKDSFQKTQDLALSFTPAGLEKKVGEEAVKQIAEHVAGPKIPEMEAMSGKSPAEVRADTKEPKAEVPQTDPSVKMGVSHDTAKTNGSPIGIALRNMESFPSFSKIFSKRVDAGITSTGDESALGKTRRVLQEGQEMIKTQEAQDKKGKTLDKLMTEMYDSGHSINKFMSTAEVKLGRKLTTDENAYVAARLYKGVSGKIEASLNKFGEAVKTAGEDSGNGNLSSYLFAQRSSERAGRGFSNPGGLTAEDAMKAMEDLKSEVGPERFSKIEDAAKKVYQYADTLLSRVKESGIINQEAYDAIKAKNQNYTPFDILEHMLNKEDAGVIPSNTKAFSVAQQDVIKGIKGADTSSHIDDPLNAFVRKTMKVIDVTERNNVAKKLVDVAKESGLGKELKPGEKPPKGFDKISLFDNGVKKEVAVPSDVAESMKRLTVKQADMVTRCARFWAGALRSGATSLNMAFIVPNAMRDFETATLVNKDGFNIADWGSGFFEAAKATGAEYGMNVDDSIFQSYLNDAGQIGGYYSTYLREVPKTVDQLTKPTYKKILGLLNPFKVISEAGTVIERAPRLGIYMKAMSKGASPAEAGFASREGTVDFAKMGETMKMFNMWVPFVNARLQGEVNIMKSIKRDLKDPKRAAWITAKIGGMAIAPFVASYYNNVSRYPKVWDDISSFEKANNIIMIYGDKQDEAGRYTQVLKIPKGDWNYFIDPVQDFLEWSRDKNTNLLQTLASDTLMDFVPLSTSPQSTMGKTAEQAATSLLPSPAKAVVEDVTNMNLYRMQPIVPKSMELAKPSEQYRSYTPWLAKQLGAVFGISPLKLENTMETLFAGLGKQAMSIAGTVEKPGLTIPTDVVGQRFTSVAGGAETKKIGEDVATAQADQATRQVIEKRAAENALKSIVSASSQEEAQKIYADLSSNPRIMKRVEQMIKDQAEQISTQDRIIKQLSPIERAQYIYKQIQDASDNNAAADLLQKFTDKGFMTAETQTELSNLIAQ